jgi:hypothetical protein
VSGDREVDVEVYVPEQRARNSLYVEFLSVRWKIDEAVTEGGGWTGKVQVDDMAPWGVGLYKLVWESRAAEDDRFLCEESALIKITGFPLASATGAAGAAAIVVGLSALLFTCRTTINEGARWAIKVVGRATVQRRKTKGEQRRLRLRPSLSVSQTLFGTLWGLLLGGGTLATLQEAALSVPTIELAIELVVPFTVISLLTGWFRLVRE